MSTRNDPLASKPQPPDRLNFATGILLDADDFQAEQLYHRGRLARALAYLHGTGTLAGLRVSWTPQLASGADPSFPQGREEQLIVEPGLAVDRLGRLIEVPAPSCIRLDHWYRAQVASRLAQAVALDLAFADEDVEEQQPGTPVNVTIASAVIADLFIRFVECKRGKTPAFASGPFDALDALQAARLRDGYELTLMARRPDTPTPMDPWAAIDPSAALPARLAALRKATFDAWREGTAGWDDDGLNPLGEHSDGQDPTDLFLARVIIPATANGAATAPTRVNGAKVYRRSNLRRFVYPSGLLARLLNV
ncbi:MAG: hypothetical protein U0X20_22935 [Caldilineaceae bacterium]